MKYRNAPYLLGIRAILWPLAAGNTVVFKASESSPRSHWALADVLLEAGLPAGALNLIFHSPQDAAEISNTLIQHPAIRKINFTGSTHVGRLLAVEASRNLKPILLELGGKASAIICEDADLKKAAEACVLGSFANVSSFFSSFLGMFLTTPRAVKFVCQPRRSLCMSLSYPTSKRL